MNAIFASRFFKKPTNCRTRVSKTIFGRLLIAPVLLVMLAVSASADDTALVFSPDGKNFNQVSIGISDSLAKELKIEKYTVSKKTKLDEMAIQIGQHNPDMIVLMGNMSIKLYQQYQEARKGEKFPPSVAVAALYIDSLLPKLSNTTGIRYEISVATGIESIQPVLQNEIKKVGVIHREWMADRIKAEAEYSTRKGIELIPYVITENAISGRAQWKQDRVAKEIQRGLKTLKSQKIDALWVLNENILMNRKALMSGWSPGARKIRKPVIVGVNSLARTAIQLGSFAVVPDHRKLGIQTASIVRKIKSDGWVIKNPAVRRPSDVLTTVNTTLAQKNRIQLNAGQLGSINNVIK